MSAHFVRHTRHEALGRLVDRRLHRELAYIDGHWIAGATGKSFEVTDPGSGADVAWVASLDAEQAGMAIDSATRAYTAWRAALPQERSRILREWHALILAAKDDLALLMTLEQGKPLKEALGEIDYAASFVEWYAEEAKRLNAESVKAIESPAVRERLASLGLEPVGSSSADCAKLVRSDIERWGPVVKAANITID